MTTTTSTGTSTSDLDPAHGTTSDPSARSSLRRTTVVVGVASAAATTAVAAALHAAGARFEIDGEAIPLLGFAQMAFLWTLVGGLIAGSLRKRSAHPRRRWIQTTVALTAVSCIPSVTAPASNGTRAALCLTHLVAAAIVIPVIGRRLAD